MGMEYQSLFHIHVLTVLTRNGTFPLGDMEGCVHSLQDFQILARIGSLTPASICRADVPAVRFYEALRSGKVKEKSLLKHFQTLHGTTTSSQQVPNIMKACPSIISIAKWTLSCSPILLCKMKTRRTACYCLTHFIPHCCSLGLDGSFKLSCIWHRGSWMKQREMLAATRRRTH